MKLLDLPAEMLAAIAAHLPADDEFAASLSCPPLRLAVAASEHRAARGRLTTVVGSVVAGSVCRLDWAASCGMPLRTELLAHAARRGLLEQLRWLRANGCAWGTASQVDGIEDPCSCAAAAGHLALLQWARADGCPWDALTCTEAARGGHLAVLRWARANGCPWEEETCSRAAWGGHLAVLQWARANGCPWDEETCTRAAWGGHLGVLQWARANGCPWDEYTCQCAAEKGHLAVLQ
jgi:hypothetical protein